MANGKRLAQLTGAIGGAVQQTMKLRLEEKLREAALNRMRLEAEAREKRWRVSEQNKQQRHLEELKAQDQRHADMIAAQKKLEAKRERNAQKRQRELSKRDDFNRAKFYAESNFLKPLQDIRYKMTALKDHDTGVITDPVKYQELAMKERLLRANMARFQQVYQQKGIDEAVKMLSPVSFEGLAQDLTTGKYIPGDIQGFPVVEESTTDVPQEGVSPQQPSDIFDGLAQMATQGNIVPDVLPRLGRTMVGMSINQGPVNPLMNAPSPQQQSAAQQSKQQPATDKPGKYIVVDQDGNEYYADTKEQLKKALEQGYKLK